MIDNILGYEIYSLEDLVFIIGFPLSILILCVALLVALYYAKWNKDMRMKEYAQREKIYACIDRIRYYIRSEEK